MGLGQGTSGGRKNVRLRRRALDASDVTTVNGRQRGSCPLLTPVHTLKYVPRVARDGGDVSAARCVQRRGRVIVARRAARGPERSRS
jgi:hypothetical protein